MLSQMLRVRFEISRSLLGVEMKSRLLAFFSPSRKHVTTNTAHFRHQLSKTLTKAEFSVTSNLNLGMLSSKNQVCQITSGD